MSSIYGYIGLHISSTSETGEYRPDGIPLKRTFPLETKRTTKKPHESDLNQHHQKSSKRPIGNYHPGYKNRLHQISGSQHFQINREVGQKHQNRPPMSLPIGRVTIASELYPQIAQDKPG